MAAFQDHSFQESGFQPAFNDDSRPKMDLAYLISLARRRVLYFTTPFFLAVVVAFAVAEAQQPLYRAQGEILLESPAVPPDLVHPTITELPDERFEVIKRRILASDNLMNLVNEHDLLANVRKTMPSYVVLTLMRSRVKLTPVTLELTQPGTATSAFTVSFDDEVPAVALQVTNELLNQILSQDSSRRTSNATEVTKYLEQEVKRLQHEHDAVMAQIEAIKQQPPNKAQALSEETKANMKTLAALEAELVQKSTVYSDEYPAVKQLKMKIAALKRAIAAAPQQIPASDDNQTGLATEVLKAQALNLQNDLDNANRKLAAARLGESMERNREAQHLQLIEKPELPHKPAESKKWKFFGAGIALAGILGAGSVFAAEALNGGIRRSQELAGIVDRRLIVTIPYLSFPGEQRRKRRRLFLTLLSTILFTVLAMAVIYAVAKGVSADLAQSWADKLIRWVS